MNRKENHFCAKMHKNFNTRQWQRIRKLASLQAGVPDSLHYLLHAEAYCDLSKTDKSDKGMTE
jgi:hypothetical protein